VRGPVRAALSPEELIRAVHDNFARRATGRRSRGLARGGEYRATADLVTGCRFTWCSPS